MYGVRRMVILALASLAGAAVARAESPQKSPPASGTEGTGSALSWFTAPPPELAPKTEPPTEETASRDPFSDLYESNPCWKAALRTRRFTEPPPELAQKPEPPAKNVTPPADPFSCLLESESFSSKEEPLTRQFTAPPPQLASKVEPTAEEVRAPGDLSPDLRVSNSSTSKAASRTRQQSKIAARVNGEPLLENDVLASAFPELAPFLANPDIAKRTQEVLERIREQFIDRELLYQHALNLLEKNNPKGLRKLEEIQKAEFDARVRDMKKNNNLTDEQFLDALQRSGMTMEAMKRIERRKFFADEYLRSRVWPIIQRGTSYPELFEYYQRHAAEFRRPESIDWEDIFIAVGTKKNPAWEDAHGSAKWVASRLRHGEPLTKLLELDDGDSKSRGGEGLGHEKGQIDPPNLERPLFKMKPGRVALVKIDTGYHVIRLARHVEAGQMPFNNETREILTAKLQPEIAERESKRIIRELRSNAVIEVVQDTWLDVSTK